MDRFEPGPECRRISCDGTRTEYRPRRPEQTPLYHVVQQHLETLLEQAERERVVPLPRYVEQELRDYLKCGIYAHGFSVLRCGDCHEHLLVAFSCKSRTACPSCGARRMCNQAASLVDRVLPNVPFRQWTFVVPFDLRYALVARQDILRHVIACFHSEVFRFQQRAAKKLTSLRALTGAVLGLQNFGGSLNLHPHVHALYFDGVFVREAGSLSFVRLPPPSVTDLEHIAERIHQRTVRFLERKGYLRNVDAHASNETTTPTALESCQRLAMSLGRFARLNDKGYAELASRTDSLFEAPKGKKLAGTSHGFNIEAGVVIEKNHREFLERVCRYILRPTLSLSRMSVTATGQIAYKLKYEKKNATHIVLSPLEFLGRIAGLIAPPRRIHLRYAGILAPHHALRAEVVKLAVPAPRTEPVAPSIAKPKKNAKSKELKPLAQRRAVALAVQNATPEASSLDIETALASPAVRASSYICWAELLKRTFSFDVLRCV